LSRKESVQGQAQHVVTQRNEKGLGVEQAREARPSHLLLQLIEAEAIGVKKNRCGASRDVIAQESEDIDQDWETKGDDESSRAEKRLA